MKSKNGQWICKVEALLLYNLFLSSFLDTVELF